jgi:hypothetical protein
MRAGGPRARAAAVAATTANAVIVATVIACTPGPLSQPRIAQPMNQPTPLGTGSGSSELELARQRLAGTWELVALESMPPSGGARVPVTASGTLIYDSFGNLTIDAHTADPAAPVAAREVNVLSFKGRAVIDVAKSELQLMALTGNVDPNEVLSPERRRRFEVDIDSLKLSSFDETGRITAISTWRRRN